MKKRVLVIMLMLVSLFNYANNENDFNKTVNANKVKVVFNDVTKGQLLTVNDENGIQLHAETVSTTGELTKFFDLSSLNNGLYTVELNKEFIIVIKSLEVKDNKVSFIKGSDKVFFKPFIRNEENLVLISKIGFHKELIKVTIFYNSEVILAETIDNETMLKRAYRLDEKLKGNYKVIVSSNNKSYSNEFKY
ncbi:hypothetical protein [Polaribacter sp. KT25b]|uniref:hypothetical protein n=1 Tax=Polaribacter sp. KT25b TaxID=1855336 RepID=UPI001E379665|nr:hypothetical protein [Polaribacter sp. KT25b]